MNTSASTSLPGASVFDTVIAENAQLTREELVKKAFVLFFMNYQKTHTIDIHNLGAQIATIVTEFIDMCEPSVEIDTKYWQNFLTKALELGGVFPEIEPTPVDTIHTDVKKAVSTI